MTFTTYKVIGTESDQLLENVASDRMHQSVLLKCFKRHCGGTKTVHVPPFEGYEGEEGCLKSARVYHRVLLKYFEQRYGGTKTVHPLSPI